MVLTYNEERNLAACLGSVAGWADEILVIDSGSADHTLEIARQYRAQVVSHPFTSHAKQWNWALNSVPLANEWVLALDADQRVTAELREEIGNLLAAEGSAPTGLGGCYVRRRQIFRGRWIKHGGYYPKHLLKLFRRDAVWVDEGDRVDHHFRVRGKVAKLGHDIVEDNHNELRIQSWVEKHNRYAFLQACEEIQRGRGNDHPNLQASWRGGPDERILWLKNVWMRAPLYLRPFAYFIYRYFFLLGFLDGKEGFIFHFLQAFWYRLLVDVNIDELRGKQKLGE
jgi:glycosyltransferase involved in cell wall biosynthesis